ncbi:hypothetical protein K438DRAFT_2007648 [Mycena galopus ATCC 62051]|nr:hypothetical protein K438DRAFT_2007648 [Mycena galopus ATCC 62051]
MSDALFNTYASCMKSDLNLWLCMGPSRLPRSLSSTRRDNSCAVGMRKIINLLVQKADICHTLAISADDVGVVRAIFDSLEGVSFSALKVAVLVAEQQPMPCQLLNMLWCGGSFQGAPLSDLCLTFLPFGWERPNFARTLLILGLNLYEDDAPPIDILYDVLHGAAALRRLGLGIRGFKGSCIGKARLFLLELRFIRLQPIWEFHEFELPPSDPLSGLSSDSDDPHAHPTTEPEDIILPPPPVKKRVPRTILPTASTAPKGDLYAQFTLIRFSTGQLLEDDLPLSFYDMQAHELLELHCASIIVPLPRAHPARYLDAYWEGRVKVLRIRPAEGEREEDAWGLYRVKTGETRAVDWRERWLVVREGNVYLCRDEPHVLLAHFASPLPSAASASTHPTSTRASSPLHNHPQPHPHPPLTNLFDSNSDSNLSSPIFAHNSSDSNRPRRKLQYKKFRKRVEPEFLVLDLKDDAAYVSLLRVLHHHSLPRSTFVDKLPVGTAELLQQSPLSAHPSPSTTKDPSADPDADPDEDAPLLRHPPSLAHLRAPPHLRSLSLGALPFPEWHTALLQRAHRAGLGRIGKAVQWVLWNGNGVDGDGWEAEGEEGWMLDVSGSPVVSRRRSGKGKGRAGQRKSGFGMGTGGDRRERGSSDGYDSDGSLSDPEGGGSEDDNNDDSSEDGGRPRGEERDGAHAAAEVRVLVAAHAEARRRAETRDAELGLPPLPLGAGSGVLSRGGGTAEVTIVRVGTGVDDRQRRAALEPSAVVTSLSGVNPPTHPGAYLPAHAHHGGHTMSAGSSTYSGHTHATPVLSSPSSTESFGFAFLPDDAGTAATTTASTPAHGYGSFAAAHSRTHSHTHTLLHSVSMHDVHPHHGHAVLSSIPPLGSTSSSRGGLWARVRVGFGEWESAVEFGAGEDGGATSVGRAASVSGGKGLLRKKGDHRDREQEKDVKEKEESQMSDWRKGKDKEKDKERDKDKDKTNPTPNTSPPNTLSDRRPRLSVSTADHPQLPSNSNSISRSTQALSPLGTPLTEAPGPPVLAKKKRRGLARGVSMRAEKFVKSLDSALDFSTPSLVSCLLSLVAGLGVSSIL